jgi:two-component system chemotaxis sensor kinase CheA
MRELEDLVEKCAAAAMQARVADLISLAQLHSDLQSVQDLSADRPAAVAAAQQAAELVEKLVLGDAEDPSDALRKIVALVNQLQSSIGDKALNGSVHPVAAAPTGLPPAPLAEGEHIIAENDLPLVAEFVGEATGHLDVAEASLLKLGNDPTDIAEVNTVFRAFHTIKGVAGFLDLKQIGALAHASETLLDLARKGNAELSGPRLDVVLEARDMMKQLVGDVDSAAKEKRAPGRLGGLPELLDRLTTATHDRVVAAPTKKDAGATSATSAATADASQTSIAESTVRVATTRLDTLINTVGELVIAQAMVVQDLGAVTPDQRLARNLSHLGKITRSLQDLSMAMRMVPIAGVFQKMARLARDTAHKAGKDVEFSQIGGETELDRNVVEAISDPLVHMVRNAIDHGLENPEDRQRAGKPRAGKLLLKARHQAGNVVIEISDDGRGLLREKIVKKAIAAGIVREEQELSEQEIFQLIFHPGLSTAEKVTDISGRGVGMDVVKKNVEALRGRIEIASTPGSGSVFTLRLPLTLAVIDGLIVKVGTHRYIIPITSIEQSLRPTREQLSSVQGKGELCKVRDRLLPIVRLHSLFNIEPKTDDPTQALVVIVQEGPSRCCLLVDELIGQQQVVIKSVGKEIGSLPGFAGCAILGDGNVSLILDVAELIDSAMR